jgi:glucan phosphorylase
MSPQLHTLLSKLHVLSKDLWWTGDPWANDIFCDLNPTRWDALNHNPIALLEECLADATLVIQDEWAEQANQLCERYTAFLEKPQAIDSPRIAYFCMEYGLHEFFQIYSGGLGILAGDHIRSAGDLKLPFVGVGLLYKFGYFNQLIIGGQQGAGYVNYKNCQLPLNPVTTILVPFKDQQMQVVVHEVTVGGARLLLLDTDVEGNS